MNENSQLRISSANKAVFLESWLGYFSMRAAHASFVYLAR